MRGGCLPLMSPVAPLSTGSYLVSEFERRVDIVQRFDPDTSPANDDVAIIKHSSENRLIDIDAFNLVHVHLNRMPTDEAPLIDDAAVGHVDFRGPASEPGGETQPGAYQHTNDRPAIETGPVAPPTVIAIRAKKQRPTAGR